MSESAKKSEGNRLGRYYICGSSSSRKIKCALWFRPFCVVRQWYSLLEILLSILVRRLKESLLLKVLLREEKKKGKTRSSKLELDCCLFFHYYNIIYIVHNNVHCVQFADLDILRSGRRKTLLKKEGKQNNDKQADGMEKRPQSVTKRE